MTKVVLTGVDISTLIANYTDKNEWVTLVFDDMEQVVISSRRMVILAFYWRIARKWGFKLTRKYLADTSIVNAGFLSKIGTIILNDVLECRPDDCRDLNQDLWKAVNEINNFASTNCQEYVKSLCALDFIKFKNIPEVKEVIEDKVTSLVTGINASHEKIYSNTQKLFEIMKTRNSPDNAFYYFANLRLINATQMGHIFYQVGLRTDVNDKYIGEPVSSNYWDGISTRNEYAYEALAAKKSVFANKMQLPLADYFGRKQHLALSSLSTIHHDSDCGATLTVDLFLTELNKDRVLWKYIVQGSRLVLLTERNIDQYLGTIINLRSALTCRFSDGVCRVCGGALLHSIHPQINIGVLAGVSISEIIVQTVLKIKHVATVNVMKYQVPTELLSLFKKTRTHIHVKKTRWKSMSSMTLSFSPKEAVHVVDIKATTVSRLSSINEASFGTISQVTITAAGKVLHNGVDMTFDGQKPMFSKDLIRYIAKHSDEIVIADGLFNVPMNDYDFTKPVFKLSMADYSMVKFVGDVENFLEKDVAHYTDISEAFADFCELIYRQVSPNICYAELIMKATLSTSKSDVRIPVLERLDNVSLLTTPKINRKRSVGTAMAFEDLYGNLLDPLFYLTPRPLNAFDSFINLRKRK